MPTFRDFYGDFSSLFRRKHIFQIEALDHNVDSLKDRKPKLWKTVGDEIIFVNRVDSCFEVSLLVKAFAAALQEYNARLRSDGDRKTLGVKGSAWVASFPHPNVTIAVPTLDEEGSNDDLPENEHTEAAADEHPNRHEFLGKGLDYGFRIASNSDTTFFALSPGLANILVRANVNEDYGALSVNFVLREPISLKGVLGGTRYPVLGIPIDRDDDWGELRRLESELLGGGDTNDATLRRYLKEFIRLHEVEEPMLKVRPEDPSVEPPSYYTNQYVPNWNGAAQEVENLDSFTGDGADPKNEIPPPSYEEAEGLVNRLTRRD
ncbi:hypothetical protein [Jannaschia seohaensis]|uniref:hypothetical protein n=1 Tax=Jannaschia seohaensis TaxID=475081 RepID=UPI0011B29B24|nr:hypothetical protein [Jannaschia seohaensis]